MITVYKTDTPRVPVAPDLAASAALTPEEVNRLLALVNPQSLSAEVRPILNDVIRKFGQDMMNQTGVGIRFDIFDANVLQYVQTVGAELVQRVNDTTKAAIRSALESGLDEGASLSDMGNMVGDIFDEARGIRAFTISRTETARGSNFGANEALSQAEIENQGWLATPGAESNGGDTRDSHAALGGELEGGEMQVVPVDGVFTIPEGFNDAGATAPFPLGFGIPRQDINCRCGIIPVFSTGADKGFRVVSKRQRIAIWKSVEADRETYEAIMRAGLRRAFDTQEAILRRAILHAGRN